jgi:hypothetical protein
MTKIEVDEHEICMTDPGSPQDLCAVTDEVLEAAWRNAVEQKAAGEADREEDLPMLRAALAGVQHYFGRQLVPTGPWRAVMHDDHGWIHNDPDEALRKIFNDREVGRITICRGTALPADGAERMPGIHNASNTFAEIDLADCETYEQGVEAWEWAQAAADGLNHNRAAAGRPAPEGTVALTMTPDAGLLFWKALIYAANRVPREARASHEDLSHEDWLRWGASRLDAALLAATEPPAEANRCCACATDTKGVDLGQSSSPVEATNG